MNSIRAIIIDDIDAARKTLAADIAMYCRDIHIVGTASGVCSGIEVVAKLAPDLLFLDIQLEDGSGFELLEKIGNYDFKVIFTTASDAFGIRAIKIGALDYLLKPIDPDDLVAAVEKLRSQSQSSADNVRVLLESLRTIQSGPRRIALNTADRVHVVNVDEIIRCESQRNYTLFHLSGKRHILVTRTLKDFDEMLDGCGFFRAHHSHLINTAFIREYVKGEGGYLVMKDGSEVPVSVRRKEALMEVLRV